MMIGRAAHTSEHLVLFAVDLTTGNRTLLSNAPVGSHSFRPLGIALDGNRAFSVEMEPGFGSGRVLALDLRFGQRLVVSE